MVRILIFFSSVDKFLGTLLDWIHKTEPMCCYVKSPFLDWSPMGVTMVTRFECRSTLRFQVTTYIKPYTSGRNHQLASLANAVTHVWSKIFLSPQDETYNKMGGFVTSTNIKNSKQNDVNGLKYGWTYSNGTRCMLLESRMSHGH